MKRNKIIMLCLIVIIIAGGVIIYKHTAAFPPERLYYKVNNAVYAKPAPNATRYPTGLPYTRPTDFQSGYYTTSFVTFTTPTVEVYGANAQ
ncbi:hypothetical protein [Chitinophaga nivalis]|uniref:Uncharacterized protein n=1 Tax=Chitinophaga nivalis TaxID=2991709 RepID=A0ABT3IGG0_9BACT|nr:hypothetical protein [Chitinophaga nivalis]MCW3467251.1 hypothetical protein [Chitinophaga nivalis]MCW3483057.1 hypothetical protein [Chitinophaga nivalis]